ncbi:MAG TPA: maleylpyruvate isomerase N-terminal domain-containing protein [Pseudonocardiaceae bacterium]|jgi:hypothetical protein|nr:maleylpyruvate isomerase N-terminal domain-containing protein [Pseudonocardiaceae bacterium]
MVSGRLNDVLPEWEGFAHAVRARRPDSGTWCEAWTVRDILVHQTGNGAELHRVLAAHIDGNPVETRNFEVREAPYRAMSDTVLWAAFVEQCERLTDIAAAAEADLAEDTTIGWTGRKVTPAFFAEHLRSELILHRWDLTGDDTSATNSLMQRWMTEHSVHEVGKPLLVRGAAGLDLGPSGRFEGRLRAPGAEDILVTATESGSDIAFVPVEGDATIESDPAVRALLLWGRRPSDHSRWHSDAGPDELRRLRTLLSGY